MKPSAIVTTLCAAFIAGEFQVRSDLVVVLLGCDRALVGLLIQRVADPEPLDLSNKSINESIHRGALNEDARAAQADLTLVGER